MENKIVEFERFENLEISDEMFVSCKFVDCEFENCTFENLKLKGCVFTECKFLKCRISGIKGDRTQIRLTEFADCLIMGVNWSELMTETQIAIPFDKFTNCTLKYNIFIVLLLGISALKQIPLRVLLLEIAILQEAVFTVAKWTIRNLFAAT